MFIIPLIVAVAFLNPQSEIRNPQSKHPQSKPIFWLIPHTHWEGAVFKTREGYLEMGLSNILTAIRLLKEHPNYRFALDQVAYFKPFLERYPEQSADFRRFVREGRLQIVGGMDVMPDDNMPAGETFVRQLLYAKGYCRDKLGVDVKVGWLLDTFGHNAQMPQILRQAGFESFWFFRGVEDRAKMPSEFLWEGLDGTRIPAFWLPFAYGHLWGAPADLPGFTSFIKQHWDSLAPFSPDKSADRVGLEGVDVSEPELHVAGLVDQFNRQPDMPFTLKIGVPTDFEKTAAKRQVRKVIKGERNPLFQGIYSSRIELKQRMRDMERRLGNAEKFAVLANLCGGRTDDEMTWRAWEPVLFSLTHDSASGVMTDPVYEDTLRSYDFVQRLAEEMTQTRLDAVTSKIDSRGQGAPVAIFNMLGWPRTDAVEADIGFAQRGIQGIRVTDPAGKLIPSQITYAEFFADGTIKRVKTAFIARDVPAVGYSVFRVIGTPTRFEGGMAKTARPGSSRIENESFRVTCDPLTGAITGITVKDGGWEVLKAPGNIVAREVDNGDFWELYKYLDGFQNVVMTRPLPVPSGPTVQLSSEFHDNLGVVRTGRVFSEFEVAHPLGANGFPTRVRLYVGIPRIEFTTRIRNMDRNVRYRVLIPTSVENGRVTGEIPFGAIERPQSQEYPAQNWTDVGDGARGVALLNRGMPGNNVADGVMMLSLLRSTKIQQYGEDGSFEQGMTSDSGLEVGKELTLQYALMPHTGDWRQAGIARSGMEFNNPLVVRKLEPHAGSLPSRWGLMDVSEPSVVVSAVKPSHDGYTAVRVYESAGRAGRAAPGVAIHFHTDAASAREANLMEDAGRPLAMRDNAIVLDLRPFEIRTILVRLRPAGK